MTDIEQIDIQTFADANGDDQQHLGFGVAANSTYRANINGNVRIDGNLVTTGTGGISASKYNTRIYAAGGANAPDGSLLTFPITTFTGGVSFTPSSLLVMLKMVLFKLVAQHQKFLLALQTSLLILTDKILCLILEHHLNQQMFSILLNYLSKYYWSI